MTDKVKKMLSYLNSKEYIKLRKDGTEIKVDKSITIDEYVSKFNEVMTREQPVIFETDMFGFNRYINTRQGLLNANLTPNYYRVMSQGFGQIKNQINEMIRNTSDDSKKSYGEAMLKCINIVIEFAQKYKNHAKKVGNQKLYDALCKIPFNRADSFYEACVFMKLCIFALRSSFLVHIGMGRFDQYMYPFYLHDKNNGITDDEIFETLEAFFVSINYDTDLYFGMQKGDNGQSMVLGGFDKDGNDMYNELSDMCIKASLELNIIDPKINLRVGKNTPDEIFELGTKLTKKGLGFPQYCNDDVVIPGLLNLGYDYEDALNYVVAACWEHIIPNCSAEVPNIYTMDFPMTVHKTIMSNLNECTTFDELMLRVKENIASECRKIEKVSNRSSLAPAVFCSIFVDGCIESLTDMWFGGTKYYNYGCHGAGISNAADALAAIKKNVYEDKTVNKEMLLKALENNFENYTEIRNLLRNSPKMGNNIDFVDDIACELMDVFSQNLNNRPNDLGGVWKAGTGSAMEYLFKGRECPATADGRKKGEPYSSSFSPSLDAKTTGVLSVIQSFTKYDMTKIINGGPLTLEIHDTVLRNDIGIRKTAMLVKNYILLGGHQLQLNSINRERLIDAQKHPENYRNLIVRVWGWSGYFNELDTDYQNHIIRRTEFMM